MNKKIFKHAISFLVLFVIFALPISVFGQTNYFSGADNLNLPKNNTVSLVTTVTNLINVVLGLLGLIAVIIILIGGFKWMTAQGSEDKVDDAKKTIKYGIVGLAIILLAYVIVRIVISAIYGFGSTGQLPI